MDHPPGPDCDADPPGLHPGHIPDRKKRTLRLLQGSEDLMKEYLRVHSQYIGKISSLSTQLVDQAIPDHIDLELHNIQDEQILAGSTGESDLAMGGSAPSSLQPDSDDEK